MAETQLAKVSQLEKALEKAKSIPELKKLGNMAEAIAHFAKKLGADREVAFRANEVHIETKFKIGEILGPAERKAGPGRGHKENSCDDATVLSKPEMSKCRKAAHCIADKVWSAYIKWLWGHSQGIPTFADALTLARLSEELQHEVIGILQKGQAESLAEAIRQVKKPENRVKCGGGEATISLGSAVDWLKRQDDCDLLLTDPPYSTDVEDIELFVNEWLPVALAKVKPTGRAYVCVGAYPKELRAYLGVSAGGLSLEQVLVWTYRNTLGPSPKMNYKLNWQAILYYVGPEAPPIDCPQMTEQFSVQDINAPDGRLGDRVHAWQKPDELAERFVRHSTKPGDLVLDPFAGTGTFLIAAESFGCVARGCEQSAEMIELAQNRGVSLE